MYKMMVLKSFRVKNQMRNHESKTNESEADSKISFREKSTLSILAENEKLKSENKKLKAENEKYQELTVSSNPQ